MGKTTVLDAVTARAHQEDRTVWSCRSFEQEKAFAYVGLRDILRSVPENAFDALPDPLRLAIDAALLRATVERPVDPHAVAAAITSLFDHCSATRPLVIALDDVQWLDADSSRAIVFAARRVDVDRVRFVFTSRPGGAIALRELAREDLIDRHELTGLPAAGLQHLVHERLGFSLSRPRLTRLHAITQGNPMFALEVARGLNADGSGDWTRVPQEIDEIIDQRIHRLSADALRTVSAIAVSPQPTVRVVEALVGDKAIAGIDEAIDAGLVVLQGQALALVHPLFAAAVTRRLSAADTRAIHQQLADAATDPVERATHLASATTGPNTSVADELSETSGTAKARGALELAAALAETAAALTPETRPEERFGRFVAAALLLAQAGDVTRAIAAADEAIGLASDDEQRSAGLTARGYAQYQFGDFDDATANFEEAARICDGEPRAEALIGLANIAARTDLEAAVAHLDGVIEAMGNDEEDDDVLYAHQAKAAHNLILGRDIDIEEVAHRAQRGRTLRHFTSYASILLWTDRLDEARSLIGDLLRRARHSGFIAPETQALRHAVEIEVRAGALRDAVDLLRAAAPLCSYPGVPPEAALSLHTSDAVVSAHMGRFVDAEAAIVAAESVGDNSPHALVRIAHAKGFVALVAGDHEASVQHLRVAHTHARERKLVHPGVQPYRADLVEALVAIGDVEGARAVTDELLHDAHRTGSTRGHATGMRSHALVLGAEGETDEALVALTAARAHHVELPDPVEHARTLLAHGTLLRRHRRRRDARDALTEARAILVDAGAEGWLPRVDAELSRISGRATSETTALTETERQVAELVGEGLTNAAIAARLFISVRTVESNLTRVYRKLELRNRTDLAQVDLSKVP